MNNTGLAEHAKNALNENWGYCLGTFGNILTEALLAQKCMQGGGVGEYNTQHKEYLKKFISKNVTDCYGLVKSYLWMSNGIVKYNPAQDRNQETAYLAAKEKGTMDSIPDIPGLVLWMKGHAGVYIGNGEFIECAGAPIGMQKGRIENGRVVSGSRFTHWFKDTFIDYENPPAPDQSGSVNVLYKGRKYIVKAENVNGSYVSTVKYLNEAFPDLKIGIRNAFEYNGDEVKWDETQKTIIIE